MTDFKCGCKKCGAPIKFLKTKAGKCMPVDVIEMINLNESGEIEKVYINQPHWINCPHANDFRKK